MQYILRFVGRREKKKHFLEILPNTIQVLLRRGNVFDWHV